MKKITVLIGALLFTCFVQAQETTSFNFTFNHLALLVKDVNRSADFYKKILNLNEIENRSKSEGMRWLSLGDNLELHLISMGKRNVIIDTASHFAFATKHFDAYINFLNKEKIKYLDANDQPHAYSVRADGVKQLYFQDPDGYWIEVNNIGQK